MTSAEPNMPGYPVVPEKLLLNLFFRDDHLFCREINAIRNQSGIFQHGGDGLHGT